jgi:hypothetical protein
MKYLKMLGLAALAALALTAVIGAGTASATLCSTEGTGTSCGGSHGKHMTAGDHIEATGQAELTSGFINVSCHSIITIKIVDATAGTGQVTSLVFTGCVDNFGRACTAVTTGLPWNGSATGTGTNGTLTVSNVAGNFTCKNPFNTSEDVKCNYAAPSASAAVTGGHSPSAKATGVKLSKQAGSHFLCSNEATWNGTYTLLTPKSLFIT